MKRVLFILALLFTYVMVNAQSNTGSKEKTSNEKIYDVVEMPPSFPGGQAALLAWIASHVNYPQKAMESRIEGRIIVGFVIECDGSVSQAKIIRSVDPLLDDEAIRVVMGMPKWTPGRQNGKNVRVKYNVPVNFRLR